MHAVYIQNNSYALPLGCIDLTRNDLRLLNSEALEKRTSINII